MIEIAYRLPQQRRKAAIAAGVGSSVPVFAADADGGVIVDVDGNSFIDLGSGIAVTSVGASNPAVRAAMDEQAGKGNRGHHAAAPTIHCRRDRCHRGCAWARCHARHRNRPPPERDCPIPY